jgi:hypothetical protein
MKHLESSIQSGFVQWFRMQYPHLRGLLFAIPNGGARNAITGAILKKEGVLVGVSDLFLAIPAKGKHGLFLEVKAPKGKIGTYQEKFRKEVENQGYVYGIFRTPEDGMQIVKEYLK